MVPTPGAHRADAFVCLSNVSVLLLQFVFAILLRRSLRICVAGVFMCDAVTCICLSDK